MEPHKERFLTPKELARLGRTLDIAPGKRLADSNAGPRIVPMPPAAAEVLAALPRVPGNPWVFPGRKKGTHQTNINDSWNRVRTPAWSRPVSSLMPGRRLRCGAGSRQRSR